MERVCGTTTSIVGTSGQLPRTEITPRLGVYAHSALFEAGARPVLGFVLGPAIAALFVTDATSLEERAVTLAALAVIGACVGLVDRSASARSRSGDR